MLPLPLMIPTTKGCLVSQILSVTKCPIGRYCMRDWLVLGLPVTVPRARLLPLIDGCAARSAATAEETENTRNSNKIDEEKKSKLLT